MECDTSKTPKMDIIVLFTHKVKSHFKKKKKITRQKKKQFHHYKVRYFMQKLQKITNDPPKPPKLPTNKKLSENVAMLTY